MFTSLKIQIALLAVTITVGSPSFAQAKKGKAADAQAPAAAQPATPSNPDRVDVTDIEQKYWASKDTDFSVVQNRLYPKEHRFAVSATVGPLVSDPNSSGAFYNLEGSYYFSERWGVAATYSLGDVTDNDTVKALVASRGARPDHNKPKQFVGVSALWVPVYAKASLLNNKIFYFDFAISPGIGMLEYEQQQKSGDTRKSTPALSIDLTQQFFFSNHFAVRADYRHRISQQHVVNWNPTGASPAFDNLKVIHDQILNLGFTFFF